MNGRSLSGVPAKAVLCADPAQLSDAGATLAASGWSLREGFALPDEPWDLSARRWACWGVVDTTDSAAAATWVLVRGCALVVAPGPHAPRTFRADLGRCGVVETYAPHTDTTGLDANERALLAALAQGLSVQQAADALFLSTRTAQRRLTSARKSLGVRTTREAVVAWTAMMHDS